MRILYCLIGVLVFLIVVLGVTLMVISQPKTTTTQSYFQTTSAAHGQKYEVQQQVVLDNFNAQEYEQMVAARQKDLRDNEKYNILTKLWSEEKDFFSAEQNRIEEYCRDNGFFYCQDITYTCDKEDKCWKVVITCDQANFEPSKLRYFEYDKSDDCRQWDAEIVTKSEFDYDNLAKQDFSDAGVQLRKRIR